MATKSKLEQAVERQASNLNDAQRELVMSQLSVYRRNDARLAQVEAEIRKVDSTSAHTRAEVRERQAARAALSYEHNQLSTANSRIASDLFDFLEE